MTLNAELAHSVCPDYTPPDGDDMVHDPAFPLILGDQPGGNYSIISHDAVNHLVEIKTIFSPPGGPTAQARLTLSAAGQLLFNGVSVANLPELQAILTQCQAYAAQSAVSAGAAATSAAGASSSSVGAGAAATTATEQAALSQKYAQGTVSDPPPVGDSAAVSAAKAQTVAVESRDLDIGADVTANETFASGFLYTERQAKPVGAIEVAIPAGIFSSPDKLARWSTYKLLTGGSVKFVQAAGGSDLVTPTVIKRGRTMMRYVTVNTSTRRTLSVPVDLPAVTDGEIVFAFHALHQGTGAACSVNFSHSGGPGGITWDVIQAYPSVPSAAGYADFYCARAQLVGTAAGLMTLSFDEGTNVHFQNCDWWVIEGVEGSLPLFAKDARAANTNRNNAQATLAALTASSLVLVSAAAGGPSVNLAFSNLSTNLVVDQSGNTNGIDDPAASDTHNFKNELWAVGHGLATAAGDFLAQANWSNSGFKPNIAAFGYKAKAVIGGGDAVLRFQGSPPRDTLTEMNGIAELWFQNDGKTVDVRIAKP